MAPSSHPTKVCVVTAARSEYGLLKWVLEELSARQGVQLQLIVTGSHLSARHGDTYREIETDGFRIERKIPMDLGRDDPVGLASATGLLTRDLAGAFADLQPDVVLVMGDRFELLSVAAACILMTVPIAHISGGEVSEGAIDDQIRHAMTKAAHLHLVSNDTHARRVLQMGEEDWRICISGEPGLDALHRAERMTREELCRDLGIPAAGPLGLVTYHPVTLTPELLHAELGGLEAAMRAAARERGVRFVITYPNADAGNGAIVEAWTRLAAEHPGSVLVQSLGHKRYLSALAGLDFMLGNSSSGLVEAPSFNMPVVNVGDRQGGRERGVNVIDVEPRAEAIRIGLERALAYDRRAAIENPYGGDGHASERVVDFIQRQHSDRSRAALLRKCFVNRS